MSAGEGDIGRDLLALDLLLQVIGKPARKLEHRLFRHVVGGKRRIAAPAYLDAGEQIGLGPRQPVEPRRFELRVLPENLRIRGEGGGRPPPVRGRPDFDQFRGRQPLGEGLAVEDFVARDLDHCVDRQRIHHRDPDAVQAARGRIGLVREFAARMEGGEDHLQRRLARIFGMLVDRNAAAIVGDGEPPGRPLDRLQHHLDPRRMAGHRLVHAVVDHLCGEMVQRPLVGAADIHARAAADGLQALEHLDGGGVVIGGGLGGGREQV